MVATPIAAVLWVLIILSALLTILVSYFVVQNQLLFRWLFNTSVGKHFLERYGIRVKGPLNILEKAVFLVLVYAVLVIATSALPLRGETFNVASWDLRILYTLQLLALWGICHVHLHVSNTFLVVLLSSSSQGLNIVWVSFSQHFSLLLSSPITSTKILPFPQPPRLYLRPFIAPFSVRSTSLCFDISLCHRHRKWYSEK